MQNNMELDDRMTDECKLFVQNTLSKLRPNDSIKIDIKLLRQLKNTVCDELNKSVDFDQLVITKFSIKNSKDDFDIQVIS